MTENSSTPTLSGFLNLYKPLGVSSAGILNTLKREMGIKKIGHGGTLDPMAEGVLPVAIGSATRLLRFLPSDKKYSTTVLLGMSSDTDDLEGEVQGDGAGQPDAQCLQVALEAQRGALDQMVPVYSAVHVKGRRLYKMAREGKAPLELPIKQVTVHSLELTESKALIHQGVECWELHLDIHCSAGTYIRSIARDIGTALGCGGCMSSLRRTWASGLDCCNAISVETLQEKGVEHGLVDPKEVVNLDLIELDEQQWYLLITGRPIDIESDAPGFLGCLVEGRLAAVIKPVESQWRSEMVIL